MKLDPANMVWLAPVGEPKAASPSPRPRRPPRRFLKGPVPLAWLAAASRLGGAAMTIGVLLWYRAGMEGKSGIRLRAAELALFGVKRGAKDRALTKPEEAGLVTTRRAKGRTTVVTIIYDEEP